MLRPLLTSRVALAPVCAVAFVITGNWLYLVLFLLMGYDLATCEYLNVRVRVHEDLDNAKENGYWEFGLQHWTDEDVAADLLAFSDYDYHMEDQCDHQKAVIALTPHVRSWRRTNG